MRGKFGRAPLRYLRIEVQHPLILSDQDNKIFGIMTINFISYFCLIDTSLKRALTLVGSHLFQKTLVRALVHEPGAGHCLLLLRLARGGVRPRPLVAPAPDVPTEAFLVDGAWHSVRLCHWRQSYLMMYLARIEIFDPCKLGPKPQLTIIGYLI